MTRQASPALHLPRSVVYGARCGDGDPVHRGRGATYPAEQEHADVRAAREAWFDAQPELDPDRLVFLDETAAATYMARRYGWAARGERCRLAAPLGHYKTTTITAALRTSGLCATPSVLQP